MFDLQHPFFRPLWIRVLITVAVFGWAIFEISMGNPFWAILFAAIGVYCVREFFIAFAPRDPDDKE
ncbi:MAG: hypothetical protein AAF748_15355 [Pseudomonadota bacterium]